MAINYGLERLQKAELLVKEKQYLICKAVVLENKDVLAALPTGKSKSVDSKRFLLNKLLSRFVVVT